jgi:hypothetical protein
MRRARFAAVIYALNQAFLPVDGARASPPAPLIFASIDPHPAQWDSLSRLSEDRLESRSHILSQQAGVFSF